MCWVKVLNSFFMLTILCFEMREIKHWVCILIQQALKISVWRNLLLALLPRFYLRNMACFKMQAGKWISLKTVGWSSSLVTWAVRVFSSIVLVLAYEHLLEMSFYSLHQVYDDKKNIAATAFDKSIQVLIRSLDSYFVEHMQNE